MLSCSTIPDTINSTAARTYIPSPGAVDGAELVPNACRHSWPQMAHICKMWRLRMLCGSGLHQQCQAGGRHLDHSRMLMTASSILSKRKERTFLASKLGLEITAFTVIVTLSLRSAFVPPMLQIGPDCLLLPRHTLSLHRSTVISRPYGSRYFQMMRS